MRTPLVIQGGCPTCNRSLNRATDAGRVVWLCQYCEQVVTPKTFSEPTPSRPAPAKSKRYRVAGLKELRDYYLQAGISSEAHLVHKIKVALTGRGWRVYRIGQADVRGSGSDAGVPDLLCIYPAGVETPCVKVLLEVKYLSNEPSSEQAALIDAGASFAVWSVPEALAVCETP